LRENSFYAVLGFVHSRIGRYINDRSRIGLSMISLCRIGRARLRNYMMDRSRIDRPHV
jgi:hypothetical protein